MPILLTNTATGTTVELPDQLDWTDEVWSPVVQAKTTTSTGALLIEEALKQSGKPYTLVGTDDKAWCTRDLVETLNAWSAAPGAVLTLTIRGTPRSVTWDHEQGALEGFPLFFAADGSIDSTDIYVPTLRLIGI